MIAAAINLFGLDKESLFTKVINKSVVEYVIDSCLASEYIQKVIIVAPKSYQIYFYGSLLKPPLVSGLSKPGKIAIDTYFGEDSETKLKAIQTAARLHGVSDIIILNGNCLLMPTWLINEVVCDFKSNHNNSCLYTCDQLPETIDYNYNSGFAIDALPFWLLTQASVFSENNDWIGYLCKINKAVKYSNMPNTNTYIPNVAKSLAFTSIAALPMMENILDKLDYSDISVAISDVNNE